MRMNIYRTLAVAAIGTTLSVTSKIATAEASGPAPTLPQATVNVAMPAITRMVYVVPGGLQAAINQANSAMRWS